MLKAEVNQAREAAAVYHRMLAEAYGPGLRHEFEAHMREGPLDYGGRPLCPYMRPHFVTARQHAFVQQQLRSILLALKRVAELAIAEPSLQDEMGLTPEERELVALPPGYDTVSAMSRLDTFLTDQGLSLVEYNAECPTGVGYNERLFAAFMRVPVMRQFARIHPVLATDGCEDVLQALLRAWQAFGGRHQPQLAIVDWAEVVTRGEFEIFAEYFEARGYTTRIVDPRHLTFDGEALRAEDYRIDVVYRRVLTSEFLQRRSECQALETAYRSGKTCFVNNFRTKLLHKKLVFAALRSERVLGGLPAEVREVILSSVPWTARLREGGVAVNGDVVDLLPWAVEQREKLVLKPNDDYGGHGITLGWDVDAAGWEAALRNALQDEGVWVLQQRVALWQEEFPDLSGTVAPRYVDLDPFIFGDYCRGFLTRLSNAAISNVTAGAGQAPTFILQ
ncbi:MAG: hypothetical protein ACYCW6_07070 [Candidatus Xenobia bacterium]